MLVCSSSKNSFQSWQSRETHPALQNMPALPRKVASTHLEEAKRVIKVTHGEGHELFAEAAQLAAKAALI